MELTGKHVIPADVHAVWRYLIDPGVLQACIPGCEEITKVSEVEFTAKVQMKIGPVSARFEGKGTLTEMAPPYRCTIVGEGQGGAAGFAKGIVIVTLEPEPDGQATVLTYSARSQVSGKIAQLGGRLIDGVARKLADVFFSRLVDQVSTETDRAGSAHAIEPTAPAGPGEPASADSLEQWYGRPLLLM
jgi:carbon monoxide dehydrogenase subunit G